MESGEGYSTLLSQAPKYLRTWAGPSLPNPVRIEGNLDITTPTREPVVKPTMTAGKPSKATTRDKLAKRGEKGKFLCWNKGNSTFMSKKPDIERVIEEHKPLMIGILEANMGWNMDSDILAIDGYELERDNLHLVQGRTRAAVYIHNKLRYKRRSDLEPDNSPAIWIEVNPQSTKPYLLFFGYREWRSLLDRDKKYSELMSQQKVRLSRWKESWFRAEKEGKLMILMGDWNIDVAPWINPSIPLTQYQIQRASMLTCLREMASENGLELMVTRPTRKQGAAKPSTIDVVFTNQPKVILGVSLVPSSSDHFILMVVKNSSNKIQNPEPIVKRSFKNYTRERMCAALNPAMLDSLLDSADPELVANVLIGHISEAIDLVAPMRKFQPRVNFAPYLTKDTKEKMKQRDILRWKAKESGNPDDEREFKRCKNITLRQQRKDKISWAKDLVGDDLINGKKVWGAVERICKTKKSSSIDKLIIDGRVVQDKQTMASGINQFFVDKVAKLVAEIPISPEVLMRELNNKEPMNVPQMDLNELTCHGLNRLVQKVRRTPAAGIDNISGIILHDTIEVIRPSLLHLINLSMATGIYPTIFKLTKIIPILKQGKDPAYPASYRPVSNISTIGKLIERAVMDQVTKHIDRHQLTHKDQHGGRSQHSTTTCLGEVIEDARTAQEKGMKVAIVAVDLSAAYDLCHHGILKNKCRILNIGLDAEKFIGSFLSSRSQLIELGAIRSSAVATGEQGVVQGGPSSGKFFNIYVNDLPGVVNGGKLATTPNQSTHKQYVDDGSTVARGKSLEQLTRNIREDFRSIQNYLHHHQMVINPGKTQLMQLKPHQKEELKVVLDGELIINQNTIKILGITINNDLKYDEYLWKEKGSLVRRIQTKTSKIAALRSFLPQKVVNQVGNAIINSTIQYGAALWGATSETNLGKIQAAQIRSARVITGIWKKKDDGIHRQELLDLMNWPNVMQLTTTATLNLTKAAINGEASSGLNSLFKIARPPEGNRNSGLRISHRGKASRNTTTFSANATTVFNNLSAQLRAPELTTRQFKHKVKGHIKSNHKLMQH